MGKRLYSIDLLKFICSIMIVLGHLQGQKEYKIFIDFTNYGEFAVSRRIVLLFFIISGFLAISNYEKIQNSSFLNYFINKAIRIYPMSIITITFCTFARGLFVYLYRYWLDELPIDLWTLLCNYSLTYYGGFFDYKVGINGPLWYISALLVCYILLFIICKLSNNKKHIIILLLLAVFCGLLARYLDLDLPYINQDMAWTYMPFFLGTLLYFIYDFCYKQSYIKHLFITSFFNMMFIIVALINRWNFNIFNSEFFILFVFLPSLLFITIYLNGYINKDISFLGGISFEIYVWHMFFIILIYCLEFLFPSIKLLYGVAFEAIFAVFIVAISTVSYLYIEQPINKMLKETVIK